MTLQVLRLKFLSALPMKGLRRNDDDMKTDAGIIKNILNLSLRRSAVARKFLQ
jgi:hypothetical protein